MARLGGSSQRLRGVEGRVGARSVLAEVLLEQWSWGTLSAVQVQTIAAAALQDGADRNELRVLSELGARGQWLGNVRRDLLRNFRLEVSVPQATTFELPIQDKYGELDWAEAPVLLPSELCRVIFHDHREHFNFLT